jgi:two-component system, response regulator YesN
MLKVLLVDDEPFILQGLREIIDWEAQGFHIEATAENGLQAIEILRHTHVDLIIADIRMPQMNGIELLETIRKEKISDARFVFLSGIKDFEIAQQAIRLHCTEYILKPVQKNDLLKLLNEVSSSVEKEHEEKKTSALMENAFYARSMVALLMGKYDSSDLENVQQRLGNATDLQYVGMEAENDSEYASMTDEEKRTIQRNLYRACLDFIGKDGGLYCIFGVSQRKGCYDVGIICCRELCSHLGMTSADFLEKLRSFVSQEVRHPILYYVGSQVQKLTELSESYRTATIAKTCRAFTVNHDTNLAENRMKSDSGTFSADKKIIDSLIDAVSANNKEAIKECVSKLYTRFRVNNVDEDLIALDMNYFLFQLIHLAIQLDDNINQEDILHYITENAFNTDGTYDNEKIFLNFVTEYSEYLASIRNRSVRGVLGQIEQEIQMHYADDISLKTLSEKYYLNSAYLGQVFKKKFGVSFKSYLTALRVEKAAQLLLTTDEKVYKVAEQVGYHDIDYFIDRFVKLKGCTPTKFRRLANSTQRNKND